MSNNQNPNQPTQNNIPTQTGATQAGQASSPLDSILQLMQGMAKPFQAVFKLRNTTKIAKNRVKELRDRVDRLEAEIEAASGKNDTGSRLDRFR
jgi:hypothetical protein